MLQGIIFDFAVATGGNPEIQITLWDNSGMNNHPGDEIATALVDLDTIKSDIAGNQMTYIPFEPAVLLTSSFYAGFLLPTQSGDTLAVFSNTDGDTDPGIAWEMWSSGVWYPMNNSPSWNRDIAMAIFPVVDYEIPLLAEFSSDNTTILIGQSVNFQDQSTGNPTSWEWIFEGGSPGTSTLQNPTVTYEQAGTFDVTLTVWYNGESSTITKSDYISVNTSQIVTDTLNFPLAGEYAYYVTDQGGYVSGNNEFGDLAKANFFANNIDLTITGILLEFCHATGGNPSIEVALWNNNGANGSPGQKIASKNVSLNTIKTHIINEQRTYLSFDPPVNVNSSFYAGFFLPTTTGDTLVIWSNSNGDTDPPTAWEMLSDQTWQGFIGAGTWNWKIALAIFPIVQYSLGYNDNLAKDENISVFPNPSKENFIVNTEMIKNEILNIAIYRADGSEAKLKITNSLPLIKIDLADETAGIYFLKIETISGIFSKKLIKH